MVNNGKALISWQFSSSTYRDGGFVVHPGMCIPIWGVGVYLHESYKHSTLQHPDSTGHTKIYIYALKFEFSLLGANVLGAVMF